MDYQNAFAISSAGMSVERLRVETASLNLANANTVAEADGSVFQALRVVSRSGATPSSHTTFGELVGQGMAGLGGANDLSGLSGPVATVEVSNAAPRRVLEPGHPMADANGFVTYAAVDPTVEMLTLMNATRSYEANVAAMNAARTMAQKALDIGGAA